jgi:hypothetical protein
VNAQLSAYPWPWNLVAYSVLGVGWLAVVWFLARYTLTRPWYSTEAGRHLVTMSACVGGFFTLYLVLAVAPSLPGKGVIRMGLLVLLVTACVWRAWMLERVDRADRRRARGEDPKS